MCGIAGLIDHDRQDPIELAELVDRMTDTLVHRGPDGRGLWSHSELPVALGHRRLSILDLSESGAQPMSTYSGRYTLTFNGEVYNYLELAVELEREGVVVPTESDTRVLCEAIDHWGIDETLGRVDGMFAIACWDEELRELHLARDRFGEKPLYVHAQGGTLRFGSELKALRADPAFRPTIDLAAVDSVLRTLYVPAWLSIYQGVRQVAPGTVETYRFADRTLARPRSFWSSAALVGDRPRVQDPAAAAEELLHALETSVRRRLRSDVPVGCLLSGGIDSSLVTAVTCRVSSLPVHTFTAGFGEATFDESAHARAVAAHLGTEHHELRVRSKEAIDLVPSLADLYDEPFADPSQIPTHLISRLAREHVKVALTGDGGDELFGGYTRYRRLAAINKWRQRLPFRRGVAGAMSSIEAVGIAKHLPDTVRKAAAVVSVADVWELYALEVSKWYPDGSPVAGGERVLDLWPHRPTAIPDDPVEVMMLHDLGGYLPGDILTKVDRASMAVGLETRLPLLSPEVAALAWRVSPEIRTRGNVAKAVPRTVLDGLVPPALTDRPKSGFGVPIESWLRGPLRAWGEDLLAPATIERYGLLDTARARALWSGFLVGKPGLGSPCWTMLTLQLWAQRWVS